jgi:DNA replication protein DnaC
MTKHAELAHLFRALKAPAAAHSFPVLADRAREEQWSYERFTEVLLGTEVSARESHGGEGRIKTARFPARKTLEEFDFTFQRSVKKQVVEHLGQLDFLPRQTKRDPARPAGHRQNALGDRAVDPGVPRRTARAVSDRHRMGRPAL